MKTLMIKAAKQTGKLLLKNFHKKHIIRSKLPHDFVTEVDLKAEKLIKKILNKTGYNFLGEETGLTKTKSDFEWVVDPLCGTTNFILGNPSFAVGIGLLFKKEIIMSAINIPVTKELYVAEKNKGAYLNGKKIKVSEKSKLRNSFVYYCHGKKKKHIQRAIKLYSVLKFKAKDFRQLGSSQVELAAIASGKAEAFLIPGAPKWDTVPGALLLKEAGGLLTDFKGNQWNPSKNDLLASNGKVHNQLLKILRKDL